MTHCYVVTADFRQINVYDSIEAFEDQIAFLDGNIISMTEIKKNHYEAIVKYECEEKQYTYKITKKSIKTAIYKKSKIL